MYDTIDQATITEGQFQSTLLKLKENEDLIKRMEAIEVAQVEELSRLREENKKLEGELRSHGEKIEALSCDNAMPTLLTRLQFSRQEPGLLRSTSRRQSSQKMLKSQERHRRRW